MPKGERRFKPPIGYITSTEALKKLGKSLYKYVDDGRIRKVVPDGHKHGFYNEEDVQKMLVAQNVINSATKEGSLRNQEAVFSYATMGDMDALYTMAVKLFPRTASAEIRRAWMRKEPRGHYLMKRVSDGAVVAYFYLLCLRPDRLADYLHGSLPSRAITPDDIEIFTIGRPVQACVMAGIGSDPDVPQELRSLYTAMLLRGVRQDMGHMGHEGIIIPRLYAFSETTEGIAMCARLGMQQWEPPQGKRCTFYLEMEESSASIIRDYRRGLADWKAAHQQPAPEPRQTPAPAAPRSARPVPSHNTLPSGDIVPANVFAQQHRINDRTFRDYISGKRWNDRIEATAIGSAGRNYGLTRQQQHDAILFFERHGVPYTPCESCPHE